MAIIKNTRQMTCSAGTLNKRILASFLVGLEDDDLITLTVSESRGQRGDETIYRFTAQL